MRNPSEEIKVDHRGTRPRSQIYMRNPYDPVSDRSTEQPEIPPHVTPEEAKARFDYFMSVMENKPEKGDGTVYNYIGECYLFGHGTEENADLARHYLEKAVSCSHYPIDALVNLVAGHALGKYTLDYDKLWASHDEAIENVSKLVPAMKERLYRSSSVIYMSPEAGNRRCNVTGLKHNILATAVQPKPRK